MVILIVELSKLQRRIGEFGIVEGKPQRLSPQLMGIDASLRLLVLGDLQMGIDRRDEWRQRP
jgi:hypothetical protein